MITCVENKNNKTWLIILMIRNKILIQFIIFITVGASSALLDLYLLYLLNLSNINTSISITTAYICGSAFNYILHTLLTFNKKINKESILKYIIVLAINYCLTISIIFLLLSFGFELIIAKIISIPIISIVGFALAKNWIYKNKKYTSIGK